MKTPLFVLMIVGLVAVSFAPAASAYAVKGECDGYEGIAACAVKHTICVAEYALKGSCRSGTDLETVALASDNVELLA